MNEEIQALRDEIKTLRDDFNAHNHSESSSKSFLTLLAETISARVFSIRKTNSTDTVSGFWAGLVGNTFRFFFGDADNFMKWDGENLELSGDIKARSISQSKFTIQTYFDSLDGFSTSANPFNTLGYLEIPTSSVLDNYQYAIAASDQQFEAAPNRFKSPLFEIMGACVGSGDRIGYIGFGDDNNSVSPEFIGFKFTSSQVYAQWFDTNAMSYSQLLTDVSPGALYIYRCEIEYGVEVRFYVQGVLKHTAPWPTAGLGKPNNIFNFSVKTTQSGQVAKLIVLRALYQQDADGPADA